MSTASQKRRKERLRSGKVKKPPKPPELTLERRRYKMGMGPKPFWSGRQTRDDGTPFTKSPLAKRKADRKKNKRSA